MFGKKKTAIPDVVYNPEKQKAVLKCSICNGEQVAGFKDLETGHFTEVMLIRNGTDLDLFMGKYNLCAISEDSIQCDGESGGK